MKYWANEKEDGKLRLGGQLTRPFGRSGGAALLVRDDMIRLVLWKRGDDC